VVQCNKMLNAYAATQQNITIAQHSNLRGTQSPFPYYRDNKHIRETKIPIFAANLKVALRKAYGIESVRTRRGKLPLKSQIKQQRPTYQDLDINTRLKALANDNKNDKNYSSTHQSNTFTNKELHDRIIQAFRQSLKSIFIA